MLPVRLGRGRNRGQFSLPRHKMLPSMTHSKPGRGRLGVGSWLGNAAHGAAPGMHKSPLWGWLVPSQLAAWDPAPDRLIMTGKTAPSERCACMPTTTEPAPIQPLGPQKPALACTGRIEAVSSRGLAYRGNDKAASGKSPIQRPISGLAPGANPMTQHLEAPSRSLLRNLTAAQSANADCLLSSFRGLP